MTEVESRGVGERTRSDGPAYGRAHRVSDIERAAQSVAPCVLCPRQTAESVEEGRDIRRLPTPLPLFAAWYICFLQLGIHVYAFRFELINPWNL